MNLTAIYRATSDLGIKHRKDDFYSSKKEYAKELRSNGFKVLVVYTDKEIEQILEESPNATDPIHRDYVKQVIGGE